MRFKRYIIIGILAVILSFTGCNTDEAIETGVKLLNKKEFITDIFIQAVTSKDGYSDPISKYMSEDLFMKINYNESSIHEDYDIHFEPKEKNNTFVDGDLVIYYEYDLEITEKDSKSILSSMKDVPAIVKVTMKNDSIVIIDQIDYIDGEEVPEEFKGNS
ncbi:MAG: hypothetical protein RR486_06915 [Clostridium sp.]|uniref:hypothetical protein n=1 Tax=Clostridium sp. TaxID=1506 RepID=UPI00305ADB9C